MGKYKINTRTGKFDLVGQGGGPGGPVSAAEVNYNDSKTGFGTGNVQGAIEALFTKEEILRRASEGFSVNTTHSRGARKMFSFNFPHYSGDTNLRIVFYTLYRVDNEVVGLCSFLISCGYKNNGGTYCDVYYFDAKGPEGLTIKDHLKVRLKKDPTVQGEIGELEVFFDFPSPNSSLKFTLGPRDESSWYDFTGINQSTSQTYNYLATPYELQTISFNIPFQKNGSQYQILDNFAVNDLKSAILNKDCMPVSTLYSQLDEVTCYQCDCYKLKATVIRVAYQSTKEGSKGHYYLDIPTGAGYATLTFEQDMSSSNAKNVSYSGVVPGANVKEALDNVGAYSSDIPTKVSDLTNDSGFQSAAEVSSAITSAINALDKSDSAVAGKYVSSVSENNGVITVTREDLPQGSGSEWGNIIGDITQQTDLALAFNNVELSLNSKQDKLSSGSGVGIDSHNNLYAKTSLKGIGVNASNEIQLLLGSGLSIGTSGADLNKLICTVKPSGGSSKSVNVLFVGNSFSKNSVAYLPYILNNIAPELEYRIAIASISGAPLAQHYASLLNQSVSVGGTTYTPTSYNYWEADSTSTRWTGGEPTDAHQTWQDAAVTKSISDILADGHWDIVCFQQGGQTAASDWNTYYAPFIYGIHSKVSEIAATNGYTTKFAWNLTHGAYQSTHANQKTAWQGTATNSEYVMKRTGTSLLFPYGTAVQNLRTTSLDAAGVGGDGIGLLSGDTTHLHEGVAKYAAAMAIALPLLHDLGIIANPVSDDFRITKALTETYNVPYPNYGTSNTVKGIDDSKCFIAQMAAIASVNNPYSETDLSGYDGNVPETYTVKNYLNSGGSYIDLGVKVLDEKWDVESKFRLAGTSTQVWLYWYRGNSGQYEQISQILYTSGDGAPRWPICSRSSAVNGTRPQVTSMNASTDYTVSTSGTHAYLNGTQLSNTMDEIEMYRPDHNFELFSKIHTNADGSSTAREVSPNIRVYNFKLKHPDGTVAIDLVPAVRDSDSAVGMIDQSTNIFYPCVGGTPSVG